MKSKGKEYLYLLVTADDYELPIAWGEQPRDLAEYLNVNTNAVSAALIRHTRFIKENVYAIKVEI